jgi:hypothetical protein
MTRMVEVTRPFAAGDRQLQRGEVVDGESWPNLELMLRNGFVRDAPVQPQRKERAHANQTQ